jgi:hypothetical protein
MTQISHPLQENDQLPSEPSAPSPTSALVTDIEKLFTHFAGSSSPFLYQELREDSAADAAIARWPLLAEWNAAARSGGKRGQ